LNLQVDGQLAALCRDYQLPAIAFEESHILVIEDPAGNGISDARSQQEQSYIADHIAGVISDFCQQTVVKDGVEQFKYQLHASLAGGRKTMTFYLGYAMSLFGRKQDVLSHVLVSPGYESSEFYYPTPYSKPIRTRDGPTLDAKDAEVTLAPIPFIRLRDEMPKILITGRCNYSDTIHRYNLTNDLDSLMLEIDRNSWQVSCSGIAIEDLSPAEVALLSMFARDAKDNADDGPGFERPADGRNSTPALKAFLLEFLPEQPQSYQGKSVTDIIQAVAAQEDKEDKILLKDTVKSSIANKPVFKRNLWDGYKNGLSKKLREQLGVRLAAHYLPQAIDKMPLEGVNRPIELQGLMLKPTQIRLIKKT
jgi:CRISPR-associated protein (TIGR02584 family)